MTHGCDSGDVTFAAFTTANLALAARSVTIATYAPPVGCGRARGSGTASRNGSGPLLGDSPEMLEVAERICRIAPSQAAASDRPPGEV